MLFYIIVRYICIAAGALALAWLLTGFAARCLLKNFVYETHKKYEFRKNISAKALWKNGFGRFQYKMIFRGLFSLLEVEMLLDEMKKRKDGDGNPLKWEDKFRL